MSELFTFKLDKKNYTDSVSKLNEILNNLGVTFEIIQEETTAKKTTNYLTISCNTQKMKEKMQRNAGRKPSVVKNAYTIGEIKEMAAELTAEEIAKRLGISRSTYFRKLKMYAECKYTEKDLFI